MTLVQRKGDIFFRTNHRLTTYHDVASLEDLTSDITEISRTSIDPSPHSDIWMGYYRGNKVALKALRFLVGAPSTARKVKHLVREMTTWIRLSHPNVLELYGISAHGAYKFALVSPWMEYGDVTGYIRTYPHVKRSALVLDIIQGLSYLHSLRPPIVHGHLTGKNVLIRPTGKACLAHVGLAAVWLDQVESAGDSAEDSCVSPVYALRWLSPERVMPEHYGLTVPSSFIPEADIYAFGMVVYEIFAGKLPFYDFLNPWAVLAAIHRGERPQHPGSTARENGLSDTMWGIVQDCWQENYKERPSANELVERVAAVVITDHVSDL